MKVLIANKYFLMNYAIQCILQKIKEFEVFGCREDEILSEIKKNTPEILIIEIEILKTDSFNLLSEISKKCPKLKILALLDITNKEKLEQIFQLKLDGYLLKNTSQEELINAVVNIHNGQKYYSKEIKDYVMENLLIQDKVENLHKSRNNLSKREREILQHIAMGKNNKEIAENLFISSNTVLTHRRNIMKKLSVNNTAQLIYKGIKHKLISFSE